MKGKNMLLICICMISLLAIMPTISAFDSSSSLATGLLGFWNFDENSGYSTKEAVNQLGLYNGEISSTGYDLGRKGLNGNAVYSNGQESGYLNITGINPIGDMTINIWVNTTLGDIGNSPFPLSKYNAWGIRFEEGKLRFFNGIYSAYAPVDINDRKQIWTMITGIRNDSGLFIYVNGTFQANGTRGTDVNNTNPIFIATLDNVEQRNRYAGEIDNFGIWNISLNTSQIQELYNNGDGNSYQTSLTTWDEADLTNSLISYWNFNETSGSLLDTTGNGRNNASAINTIQFLRGVQGKSGLAYTKIGDNVGANQLDILPNGYNIQDTGILSISTWIYHNSTPSVWENFAPIHFGNVFMYWTSGSPIGEFWFDMYQNTTGVVEIHTFPDKQGVWQHLVMVLNGTQVIGYVDGTRIGKANYDGTIGSQSMFQFMFRGWLGNYSMDETALFNKGLSYSEVQSLYNNGQGIFYGAEAEAGQIFNITTCIQLQNMSLNLTGNYLLMNNIDCSDTINWNSGEGFTPIGNDTGEATMFSGTLNGQGYNITNLFINRSADNYVGLLGYAQNSITKNVGLINVFIQGNAEIGSLYGQITISGAIENSYVTGTVIGNSEVGGLWGYAGDINCTNSYTIIDIISIGNYAGGLGAGAGNSLIKNCSATGNVIGVDGLGGLVGGNVGGTIYNSYATGNIIGSSTLGGLLGYNQGGTIINSYATGNVTGSNTDIGGLIGYTYLGIIENTYSVGLVVGVANTGGLIGLNENGTYTNSYWNKYLSGQTTSAGGTELSNTELLNQSSYVDWDFTNIWNIQTNSTPYLRFHPEPIIYNNLPVEEEIIEITSVIYDTPITLNGGTTKDIYIMFETSSASIDDTTAQVIVTNGAESRTSSSCTNSSTIFNCTISMQFYDSAGSWNINASMKNLLGSYIENSTASFIVNELNYVTQNINYIKWTTISIGVDNVSADNTITLTNGGNQDYGIMNIKAYDVYGLTYGNLISASNFSVSNITSNRVYLQNNTDIDVSSILNLNSHSASSTKEIYFYIDSPKVIRADEYRQVNSWVISLTT